MNNYRTEIDGLRAIAVISVVLYHAKIIVFGKDWFEGGFLGVDIFFVISGYLITRIIISELEQTNTFSFIKFYERRARRILPMLFLVIAVCIPFGWQKLLPNDLVDFAKSALSAIGFGSNFFFYYSTTEYGANSALLKPLLHTWSLGVEEQFYLIFPIIMFLIWKLTRLFKTILLIGMLLLSLWFAEIIAIRNPELNFFLPFSRFWELLFGSALSFIEFKYGRLKKSLLAQILPIVGIILIFISIISFKSNTPHPSFHTLIPVVGTALIIACCSKENILGKVLSLKPIRFLGLISYSLYLWHFPIFAFGRVSLDNPSNLDKYQWITVSVILSILSYFLIEKIFRDKNLIKKPMFLFIIITFSASLIYVNFNLIINKGYNDRLPKILFKKDLDTKNWKTRTLNGKRCHGRTNDFCKVDNGDLLTTIFALQDSHLSALSPQIASVIDKNFNYLEANIGGCPFVLNVNRYKSNGTLKDNCTAKTQAQRYKLINKKPSIVLFGARYPLYLSTRFFDNQEGGKEEGASYFGYFKPINDLSFVENIRATIQKLLSDGHHVILMYPIPEVGVDVPNYIYQMVKKNEVYRDVKKMNNLISTKALTTSYDVYKERSKTTFEAFDSIKSPNIYRVYPHKLFCDNQTKGRCITHDNQYVFYHDDDHPSAKGSEMIVELIMEKVTEAELKIRQFVRKN